MEEAGHAGPDRIQRLLNRTHPDRPAALLSWTDDRERCSQAGIDDSVTFEAKVVMARTMVRRALAGESRSGG